MALVTPDTSPADLLDRVRGLANEAGLTYPERAHLPVIDERGGRWLLATWEANYAPKDPAELNGKIVVDIDLGDSGELLVHFSDGTRFDVTPVPDNGDDAIESWKLFTPEGWVLVYGPWGLWRWVRADEPLQPIARP
jgi:hypothetical protein